MSTQPGITPPLAMMPPPPDAESNSVNVPLNLIIPSKTNPGRAYNPKDQNDVDTLESIRVHKVLQPILLRPAGVNGSSFQVKGHYEIVAGERRYNLSKIAGHPNIPAVIRKLTDVQALEIQYIENDQRKDLDPMAKAAAARRLWEAYAVEGVPTEERIDRMVKSISRKKRTVYDTLKLGNLISEGQKLLKEGEIVTISHAYEICRRPAAVQKEIVEYMVEQHGYGDSVSVRELKEYIRQECDRFLDSATFDKKSPTLVEKAGACTDCQKNTAVNPLLVDDSDAKGKKGKSAMCTDRECWNEKVQANLVQIEKAAEKEHGQDMVLRLSTESPTPKGAVAQGGWKEVKSGTCKNTFAAVIVDGDNAGKTLFACASPNLCKTHWSVSDNRATSHHGSSARPRSDAEKKTMLAKQRNKKADQAFRAAAAPALRKTVTDLKTEDLRDLALQMIHMTDRRHRNPIFATMGWKVSNSAYGPSIPVKNIEALKHPDLCAFLALMTVASKVLPGLEDYWPQTHVPIAPFAKRHKIDLEKIEKVATAPLRERWRQIDTRKRGRVVQTPAKRKAAAA